MESVKIRGRVSGRSRSRRRGHPQLRIRCAVTKAQQALIERAAAVRRISVSRFVAEAALREARALTESLHPKSKKRLAGSGSVIVKS